MSYSGQFGGRSFVIKFIFKGEFSGCGMSLQLKILMIYESVLVFFDPLPAETCRHASVCDEDCLPKAWEFSVDFLPIQVWFIRITFPTDVTKIFIEI